MIYSRTRKSGALKEMAELLLILFLAACGGGGSSSTTAISFAPAPELPLDFSHVPKIEPVTIAALSPKNGTIGVDPRTPIRVQFNKPIDPTTLNNATFYVSDSDSLPLQGAIAYDQSTQTATLTLDQPLAQAASYIATLSPAIQGDPKTTNGEPIAFPYHWRFTTSGSPTCSSGLRSPYIAFATPATATIGWNCGPGGVIEWGPAPNLISRFEDPSQEGKHFVTLTGLRPNSLYHYRVSLDGASLGEGTFQTARPAGDNQFTFVVFGDSGVGSPDQLTLAAEIQKIHPALVLTTGDMAYEAGYDPEYDAHYFGPYHDLISQIPFFLAAGDHDLVSDSGATFLANFFHPTGKLYYDYHWGDTHFIALDSTQTLFHSPDPAQLSWFEETIASSAAKWKVVYFHHPPYNSGLFGNLPNMNDYLPLFEKYHVNLVFTGHAHDYERTNPINGVTYFVTGGGGAVLTQAPGMSSFTAYSKAIHHILVGTMTSNKITIQALDTAGNTFDTVTLTK